MGVSMGGGLVFGGIGALFAFYGMRFIRDKSSNYRFTKGLTLLGLVLVFWGTFPQAQRFSSGTQIFAQMIAGMLFFGVGGALVGFLIDWYRRQDNGLNGGANPENLQGCELDSKVQTSSGSTLQPIPTHQSKSALSATDLVRLEQLTSLRERGTLSQSQFEIERDIILGVSEPINESADTVRDVSPPLPPPSAPPPTPPERSPPAGVTVQRGSGSNAGFIAVMLLPFILIGLVVYGGGTGSSPAEVVAETTQDTLLDQALDNQAVLNEEANKCYEAIAAENWQAIWYSCPAEADKGDALAQTALGFMYEHGRGVEADVASAVSWYRKAAAQGSSDAQNRLDELGY